MSSTLETRIVTVRERVDVYFASRLARTLAEAFGFEPRARSELGIVTMELGSNLVKHARGGELQLRVVDDGPRGVGLELVALDSGPPIHDLQLALRDSHDDRGPIAPEALVRRGGLGAGLGAVLRMTHSFEHVPTSDGKLIRVVRYRDSPPPGSTLAAREDAKTANER